MDTLRLSERGNTYEDHTDRYKSIYQKKHRNVRSAVRGGYYFDNRSA